MQPRPISARHCCKSRVLGMFEQQIIGDSREPKLRGFALGSVSLSLHLGVLAAFWLIWFLSHGELRLQPKPPGIFIDLSQFVRPRIAYDTGGGGDLRKLPVSRGNLPPQRTTRVFIIPITNPRAQLTIPNQCRSWTHPDWIPIKSAIPTEYSDLRPLDLADLLEWAIMEPAAQATILALALIIQVATASQHQS